MRIRLWFFIPECIIFLIMFLFARTIFKIYWISTGIIMLIVFLIQNRNELDIKNALIWGIACFVFGFIGLPYLIIFKDNEQVGVIQNDG